MKIKLLFGIGTLYFYCVSCCVNKESYAVINTMIDKNIGLKDCDSLSVVNTTISFEMVFFESYNVAKLKENSIGFLNHHPYITWANPNDRWVLDEKDVAQMKMEKPVIGNLDKRKIRVKSIIDWIELPVYKDKVQQFKDLTNQAVNCNFKEHYSAPLFNRKKDKAVIMVRLVSDPNQVIYFYILKKEKSNWVIVGHSNYYSE
ncbi:hypothetical protein [Flavobacterium sp.]|uniref:hypothetical protein n=1 Tax=Flavobacterium sp. TaxID=239 RepID=UPI00333EADB0